MEYAEIFSLRLTSSPISWGGRIDWDDHSTCFRCLSATSQRRTTCFCHLLQLCARTMSSQSATHSTFDSSQNPGSPGQLSQMSSMYNTNVSTRTSFLIAGHSLGSPDARHTCGSADVSEPAQTSGSSWTRISPPRPADADDQHV